MTEYLGDVLQRVLMHAADRIVKDAEADVPLKERAGMTRTLLRLGVDRLMNHADRYKMTPEALEKMALGLYEDGHPLCESPIERMVLAAMITHRWTTLPIPLVHDANKDETLPLGEFTVIPQFKFSRARFDFGLVVRWDGSPHIIAVECDGKEHHNPFDDARRDRYLASWGIPTFRLKGTDIYNNAREEIEKIDYCLWEWRMEKLIDLRPAAAKIAENNWKGVS